MARSFWTGLLHGTVVGAFGLTALSLLAPLSEGTVEPQPMTNGSDLHPDPPSGEVPQPQSMSGNDATPDPSPTQPVAKGITEEPERNAPQAAAIDLPEGSDFGRGHEVAPVLPAQIESLSRQGLSEPPAVAVPTAEPEPITATGADMRPDIVMPKDDFDHSVLSPSEGEEAPDINLPEPRITPQTGAAPGMSEAASQDRLPVLVPEDTGEGARAEPSENGRESQSFGDGSADSAPDMPAPGPDLSIPPDLSELRSMQRE